MKMRKKGLLIWVVRTASQTILFTRRFSLIIHGNSIEFTLALKVINDNSDNSWFSILQEEVYEAFAETEPAKQREEMIQVAAVAVQIIEYLDRRSLGGGWSMMQIFLSILMLFIGLAIGFLIGRANGSFFATDVIATELAHCASYGGLLFDRYKVTDIRSLCPVCPELTNCPHVDNRIKCWEYDEAIKKMKEG